MCPNCKSWWELCPECENREEARARFDEGLKRAMKRDSRSVCCCGAGDSNWNSIQVALYGKSAIIR
jgi:hypothetical protein